MDVQAGKLVNRFLRSVGLGSSRQHQQQDSAAAGVPEDSLECPVCWEGLDTGDHTPHILFCGHTLCRSCVIGLRWATIKVPSLQVRLPLLISCPWCQFLTLRLYWKGGIRFPPKNFFLLSIVDSVRGSSSGSSRSTLYDSRSNGAKLNSFDIGTSMISTSSWGMMSNIWQLGFFSQEQRRDWSFIVEAVGNGRWSQQVAFKLVTLVVQLVAKLPLVCLLLFILLYVLPFSALVLALYCLVTLIFAIPSYLVLYFAYPGLVWLTREIAAA